MINRRATLQALFSFVAAGFTSPGRIASGGLLISDSSVAGHTVCPLEESLRATIVICRNQPAATEFNNLAEVALDRVHRSPEDAPAFWQACVDSVSRLEAQLAADQNTNLFEVERIKARLYQLRNLRDQLAVRTVQAIGGRSRVKSC
jgi:hypothetical protein